MKTICVGGDSSNSGKTSVVVLLSRVFPGWAAVKVTPCREDTICPHGHACGACAPPDGPFEIVRDHEVLAAPGKDTARYLEAGVSRALWVRSAPESLPAALDAALEELRASAGVIVESTTGISVLDGLKVLVVREGGDRMKESVRKCLDRVDIVALNFSANGTHTERHTEERLRVSLNQRARIIPMCAALSSDAPMNRDFIDACLNAAGT